MATGTGPKDWDLPITLPTITTFLVVLEERAHRAKKRRRG